MKAIATGLLIAISLISSAVAQTDVVPTGNSVSKQLALDAFDACDGKKFDYPSKPQLAYTKQLMREAWGVVYPAHFSQGELRMLTDFCKTPAGMKFIAERENLDWWVISAMEVLEKQKNAAQNKNGSSK